jgi:alpha 1,3-glucosidase
VFKISRNTVPKDSIIKYDKRNYEHREAHNLYGYLMHKATYEALMKKYDYRIRPFILTRSFYIGSHRYAAMWTGDTKSTYHGLKDNIAMMISLSLSGYSFIGCDVGGFAEQGNINLYRRWYQSGVFYPFFRGHSHESTLRREIWLFSEKDFLSMKKSILLRYSIIPYIYTQFYLHYKTGIPIIKPVWFYDQSELALTEFADIEYFFGNSILVRPVLFENEDENNIIDVYLPENERWYDFYDFYEIKNKKKVEYKINPDKIGAFIKGGEIIQKKMRIRRSIQKMKNDPLTIVIALNLENESKGVIYFDDEESLEYQKGKYSLLEINYNNKKEIDFKWINYNYEVLNNIEKIIIIGENEMALFSEKAKAEIILKNNEKYNLEIQKNSEKKMIEIIRLNKYQLVDIKKIILS